MSTEVAYDAAQEFMNRETFQTKIQNTLHRYPWLSSAIVLAIALVVFGRFNENFLTPSNFSLILQQVAIVGAVAAGQTVIILTAGIDLSCGAMTVLVAMVMATLTFKNGVPIYLSFFIGFVIGFAAGSFNGFLVTKVKLPPFIVTLGTLNIFTAITLIYSKGRTIRNTEVDPFLMELGKYINIGSFRITTGVIAVILLYLILAFALRFTGWGRHVYAVGDDIEAARLAGISVNRVLMSVYALAGVVFAFTAWVQIGRVTAASPNVGGDLNLDSITAVVIGGTSLFGGRGAIFGSFLGAILVGVFRNGLTLAGVDLYYQIFAVGVLILFAVSVDQWIRKARS